MVDSYSWEALLSTGSWTTSFARSSIISFLDGAIVIGCLKVTEGKNQYTFGRAASGANVVQLVITANTFWSRIFYSGELGFSEAYMVGEVQVINDNITGVMNLWLDNESTMSKISSPIHRTVATITAWVNAYFGQSVGRARLNAMASYDQSNELFKAFLSEEMMYSCALWSEQEGGVDGDLDGIASTTSTGCIPDPEPSYNDELMALEAAQKRKIAHVLSALHLRPGSRLLEFGTGWGALAITAAQNYGAEVVTLTLSVEQQTLAEERIREVGLQDRIRVHLMDYRLTPREWDGSFDAFVSVEMIEHVGPKHYETYFDIIDRALKPSGAIAVITGSTFPEKRYTTKQTDDFMRRYMWPNSALPSATALITAAHKATQGRLSLESVENHGPHYARTLREWGRRLERRLTPAALGLRISGHQSIWPQYDETSTTSGCEYDQCLSDHSSYMYNAVCEVQPAATLLQVLPDDPRHRDEQATFAALKRKWQYLFAYAGAGFSKGYITCHMLTFTRPGSCHS